MNERKAFQRTDKAIMQALIRLLKAKRFEQITVKDILAEAPVSRGTFYAHFQDKYEIAERMQEIYLSVVRKAVQEVRTMQPRAFGEFIRQISEQQHDLGHALLQIHTDQVDLLKHINQEMQELYLSLFSGEADNPADLATEARIFGSVIAMVHQEYMEGSIPLADGGIVIRAMGRVLMHMAHGDFR